MIMLLLNIYRLTRTVNNIYLLLGVLSCECQQRIYEWKIFNFEIPFKSKILWIDDPPF